MQYFYCYGRSCNSSTGNSPLSCLFDIAWTGLPSFKHEYKTHTTSLPTWREATKNIFFFIVSTAKGGGRKRRPQSVYWMLQFLIITLWLQRSQKKIYYLSKSKRYTVLCFPKFSYQLVLEWFYVPLLLSGDETVLNILIHSRGLKYKTINNDIFYPFKIYSTCLLQAGMILFFTFKLSFFNYLSIFM